MNHHVKESLGLSLELFGFHIIISIAFYGNSTKYCIKIWQFRPHAHYFIGSL